MQTHIGSRFFSADRAVSWVCGCEFVSSSHVYKDWIRTQSGTRWEVRHRHHVRSPHTNRYVRAGGFSYSGPLVGLLASLEESLMTRGWRGEFYRAVPANNPTLVEVINRCYACRRISELFHFQAGGKWFQYARDITACSYHSRCAADTDKKMNAVVMWKLIFYIWGNHERCLLVQNFFLHNFADKKSPTRSQWYSSAETCWGTPGAPTWKLSTLSQIKKSS